VSDRTPTIVASGFLLPECPRWHDDALWFVDMLRGNVNTYRDGVVELFASFGRPSSLGFRPNGDLLIVDGSVSTLHTYRGAELVKSLDLSEFGGLNDMAIDGRGHVYIDCNPRRANEDVSLLGRWEPTGRVLLVPTEGEPRLHADGIIAPNGIGVSPDGRTLVVGESMGPGGSPSGARMHTFDIADDGSLSGGHVTGALERGTVDGLCFDSEGAVWVGTAFGHDVQRWLDGEMVDRIPVPDRKWPLAVALGGPEMRTLFVCTAAAPPKGDPSKFTEAWLETVEVDVSGPAGW
jgi:sugar lactone lactonase YvrE